VSRLKPWAGASETGDGWLTYNLVRNIARLLTALPNWSNSPEAKEKAAECESGGFLFNFKLLGVTTG
jgi:hypothetical protein